MTLKLTPSWTGILFILSKKKDSMLVLTLVLQESNGFDAFGKSFARSVPMFVKKY